MATQPRRYRQSSWLCFAYLLAAVVVLGVAVCSAMDYIHGGAALTPSVLQVLSIAGDLLGVAALLLLLIRGDRSNSNFRAAILATVFGLLIFGLATAAALNHPAVAPTGHELNSAPGPASGGGH